jgi:hypothetical protein
VIKDVKRLASDCRDHRNNTIDSEALHNFGHALAALHFLSYRVPIHLLLSLPSVQSRLDSDLGPRGNVEDLVSDDGKLTRFQCFAPVV